MNINRERQLTQIAKHDPVLAQAVELKIGQFPEMETAIIKKAMRIFIDDQKQKENQVSEQTNGNEQPAPIDLGEAPASATCKMVSPQGVEWLLTARDSTVAGLMDKVAYMEQHLLRHEWQPANGRYTSAQSSGSAAPMCPAHQKPMQPSKHKEGEFFCPVKVADDDGTGRAVYCKQKSKA